MCERIIELGQATLIAEHTGFGVTILSDSRSITGSGGSGGAFSIYYAVTEIKDVKAVINVMTDTYKAISVEGIPRGKRKARTFPSIANEVLAPRSLILRGWGLPAPPNPTRLNTRRDAGADSIQIAFNLSSADWDRLRNQLFDEYVASVREHIVVDFPSGAGCEP